jgi:hypothetical protein
MRMRSLFGDVTTGGRRLRLLGVSLLAGVAAWACNNQTILLPTPSNLPRDGSLSGTVTTLGTGAPVPGAALVMGGAAAIADTNGRFTLTGIPSTGLGGLTATAPGFLLRSQMFALATARTDVAFDMIADAAPFSLQFYRFFVRDGFEGSTLQRTNPWTVDPSFHVVTIVEGTSLVVDPAIVEALEANFRRSVPELSGGRRQVAAFETGTVPRASEDGWVNLIFSLDLQGALGRATVGGDRGTMWLRHAPASNAQTNTNNCLAPEVFVADHEITHIMGFWHTPDLLADTFSGAGCPGAPRPAITALHAGVMYSRPRGNRDPDLDPSEIVHSTAPIGRAPVVECRTFGRR